MKTIMIAVLGIILGTAVQAQSSKEVIKATNLHIKRIQAFESKNELLNALETAFEERSQQIRQPQIQESFQKDFEQKYAIYEQLNLEEIKALEIARAQVYKTAGFPLMVPSSGPEAVAEGIGQALGSLLLAPMSILQSFFEGLLGLFI